MKKVIIAVGALLVLSLAGYFVWQNDKQDKDNSISKRDGVSNFERPEEKAAIAGIVKTIIGNEVTILKIERPEISNDNDSEDIDPKKDESENEQKSGSDRGMGMGGGIGSRMNTETGDKDSDERLEMLKSMSTGEEKVTIPVGIKMLKSDDGEAIVATLDDITKDQMLMIWIDKTITDKNIATFVMIK
ncbi:hypothetical protein KAI56_01980 [Candidatus Parcubacteria bacterium]|nr:hypothetical protein [Candidatus Parcubacteria bacterium]